VVDNEGHEIFADKVGVMLARDFSRAHPGGTFVVDVKSTGLYLTDPVLKANGARADYWKTGHSYMKRRTHELSAIAGFEKSGHYFLRPPYGLGYDDGLASAVAIVRMLDHAPEKTMADLYRELPQTWGSPTMAPHCPDERKYAVVEKVTAHYRRLAADGARVAGRAISDLVTVNGIRVVLDDGTWGLVRASSNKPELVVVCESPVSEEMMKAMFRHIDHHLSHYPEVGAYNQKI
jgi:phosphomannomutase/phosphoglucomutase